MKSPLHRCIKLNRCIVRRFGRFNDCSFSARYFSRCSPAQNFQCRRIIPRAAFPASLSLAVRRNFPRWPDRHTSPPTPISSGSSPRYSSSPRSASRTRYGEHSKSRRTLPWRGQIFLRAASGEVAGREHHHCFRHSTDGWSYQVQLPDVLSRTRLAQAMTVVLLLEFANRNAGTHSAEIPAWLTDGLSQQLLAGGLSDSFYHRRTKS